MRFNFLNLARLAGRPSLSEVNLSPQAIRSAIRSAYVAQAFGNILTTGLFRGGILPLFALSIGANNLHLGLLSAMPQGLSIFAFFVTPLVARYGKRRWLVTSFLMGSFSCLGYFLVYPAFLSQGAPAAIAILLAVVFLQSTCFGFSSAAWWPLLNDILPRNMIAFFFSRLRTIFEISALVVVLLSSVYLGQQPPIWKFLVIIGIATLGQFLRVYFLARLPDWVGAKADAHVSIGEHLAAIKRPMLDVPFFTFCVFTLILYFLINIPIPLYIPFLKLSRMLPTSLTIIGIAGISTGNILSYIAWGKFADRYGAGTAMVAAIIPLALILLELAFIPRYDVSSWLVVGLVAFSFVIVGVGMSGIDIGLTIFAFHKTPAEHSSTYMGLNSLAAGLSQLAGPIIGGGAAQLLSGYRLQIAGLSLESYQLVFIACSGLLLLVLPIMRRLPQITR